MNCGAPYTAIADALHIHPTLCEAVQSAVSPSVMKDARR